MATLQPPHDESIRTLYVCGFDKRIDEQDIRDKFSAHGEIEILQMVPSRACAFVTYTTREGAEKAAKELPSLLVINGQKLKLMWPRPQAPIPEPLLFDEAWGMPLSRIKDRYYGVNHLLAKKILKKAGEMPSLEPPDDESIRNFYVGGLDKRINEPDIRDNFNVHGEIETIKMVPSCACAFVTYMTRESAEKAAKEFSNKLVIKGLRLKLMWGNPQAPQLDSEVSDEAKQQAANLSELMQNRVLQPPGTQDQHRALHYFNIPPLVRQQGTAYYPLHSQITGAGIPSHKGTSSGSIENKKPPP